MDINCKPKSFETVYAERTDIDNETEYTLSEYMPNVQRIIKTDVHIKITDKSVSHDRAEICGETVYTVLYVSENSGLLKCVVFKDDFSKEFVFPAPFAGDPDSLYISARVLPGTASSKISGQRRIVSRSKFSLICEIADICRDTYCDGTEEASPDCEIEYLRRNLTTAETKVFENIYCGISDSIRIDENMPEISDIVCAQSSVCVKSINQSEGEAEIAGELTFTCLYEAKNGETSEYVSMERTLPFKTRVDMPDTDGSWKTIAEASLTSLSADSSSDNYGEQKMVDIEAGIDITVMAFKNSDCSVYTDIYSTECCITPQRNVIRTHSLVGNYTGFLEFSDRIRFELRGITDIVSTSINLAFGSPEFSDGTVFVPARGTLCVLGMKENGEIDAQTSAVNLHIPAENIPYSLSAQNRLHWFNFSSVCRHECELVSGELQLRLWINQSCAALCEESTEIVCGYSKCDSDSAVCKKSGFTLYYPQAGESVWSVAKSHLVSCERLRAENGVEGDFFDGKKAVILH